MSKSSTGDAFGVETEGISQPIKRENQHVGTVTRTLERDPKNLL